MPFAQWGYRGQSAGTEKENFEQQFPADFISEALDQTRGWFYSLLAISTLLFDQEYWPPGSFASHIELPHPYRNCIVLGLMLSEWYEDKQGQVYLGEEDVRAAGVKNFKQVVGKMSKSSAITASRNRFLTDFGADALRWYFFANQAPWTSIRYSERAIKDSIPEFLLRLWNVYSFFVIYANIDGFDPAKSVSAEAGQLDPTVLASADTFRPRRERAELDRWVLSELQQTIVESDRADGRLRQLRRLQGIDRLRRRAEQLVRPPQPRSLLERR